MALANISLGTGKVSYKPLQQDQYLQQQILEQAREKRAREKEQFDEAKKQRDLLLVMGNSDVNPAMATVLQEDVDKIFQDVIDGKLDPKSIEFQKRYYAVANDYNTAKSYDKYVEDSKLVTNKNLAADGLDENGVPKNDIVNIRTGYTDLYNDSEKQAQSIRDLGGIRAYTGIHLPQLATLRERQNIDYDAINKQAEDMLKAKGVSENEITAAKTNGARGLYDLITTTTALEDKDKERLKAMMFGSQNIAFLDEYYKYQDDWNRMPESDRVGDMQNFQQWTNDFLNDYTNPTKITSKTQRITEGSDGGPSGKGNEFINLEKFTIAPENLSGDRQGTNAQGINVQGLYDVLDFGGHKLQPIQIQKDSDGNMYMVGLEWQYDPHNQSRYGIEYGPALQEGKHKTKVIKLTDDYKNILLNSIIKEKEDVGNSLRSALENWEVSPTKDQMQTISYGNKNMLPQEVYDVIMNTGKKTSDETIKMINQSLKNKYGGLAAYISEKNKTNNQ